MPCVINAMMRSGSLSLLACVAKRFLRPRLRNLALVDNLPAPRLLKSLLFGRFGEDELMGIVLLHSLVIRQNSIDGRPPDIQLCRNLGRPNTFAA
jgi:hypothetical protein